MLVVRDKDDRILPERPVTDGIHDLGHISLAALNVRRRMLVVFQNTREEGSAYERRVHERYRRQGSSMAAGLAQEGCQRKEMRVGGWPEATSLWQVLEVVSPGDVVRL